MNYSPAQQRSRYFEKLHSKQAQFFRPSTQTETDESGLSHVYEGFTSICIYSS